MDWTIIGIVASAVVSLGSFAISIYNARVNRDKTEIDNLSKIIDVQGNRIEQLTGKVDKLERKDRVKTEAIQTAYRCRLYNDKTECPVITHITEKYQNNNN